MPNKLPGAHGRLTNRSGGNKHLIALWTYRDGCSQMRRREFAVSLFNRTIEAARARVIKVHLAAATEPSQSSTMIRGFWLMLRRSAIIARAPAGCQ